MKKNSLKILMAIILVALVILLVKMNIKPVETLIRPPKVQGENAAIELAFENFVGEKYSLKSPLSGKYNSSYIFKDLNGDGDNEVVVFYTSESTADIVKMNILSKSGNMWQSVANYESSHNEIHQVDFADLNLDGQIEIIVGWSIFDSELANTLNVFKTDIHSDNDKLAEVFTGNYLEFSLCDVDGNMADDIVIFEKKSVNDILQLNTSVYTFLNDSAQKIGDIPLDPTITSIKNVSFDHNAVGKNMNIYIDGYKSDSGMTTDVLFWDGYTKSLQRIHYDDTTTISAAASRSLNILSRDINDDGIIEIPFEAFLRNSSVITIDADNNSKEQSYIKWMSYSNGELSKVKNEIFNSSFGYSIIISDNWIDRITVENDIASGTMTFYELNYEENKKDKKKKDLRAEEDTVFSAKPPFYDDNEQDIVYSVGEPLFSVYTFSDEDTVLHEISGYKYIKSKNQYSYYFEIYEKGEQLGITKDVMKSIIVI